MTARDGAARAGVLHTAHGDVETPAFMPVGTAGTVKAMTADAVRATGAAIVLGNTYHLMLRPGAERIARLGGLHRFMDWPGPILTDSGGFQVMSLAKLRKLDAEGVTFQSHLDGSRAPADAGALDRDPAQPGCHDHHGARRVHPVSGDRGAGACIDGAVDALGGAVEARHSWNGRATRCSASCRAASMPGFARRSAEALRGIGFDGYAIGGLAVGEGQATMFDTLDATVPHLPPDAPRYLMGVGTPDDLIGAVARGHRHVRLRDPDPGGTHRARLHPPAARSTCATPASPTMPRRSIPAAHARPARATAAPICTICSAPRKCSGRCC